MGNTDLVLLVNCASAPGYGRGSFRFTVVRRLQIRKIPSIRNS
jgi:hypothetical protein